MKAAVLIALVSSAASAYPTMIRHGYAQCATCHTDPAGGSLLTAYGKAQSELLLSTRWSDREPTAEPSNLTVGGWLREGYIWNESGGKLVDHRALQMRADLAAYVRAGFLRASAQVGYSGGGAELAQVTRNQGGANLISREHWIGAAFADEAGLVRAGRIALPFGLRNLEHTSFVRTATRTDTNQDQQDGLAVAFGGDGWRGEAMAIAGNYSLRPDTLRERGLAATVETTLSPRLTAGVSALAARSTAALDTGQPTLRQAYGLTARAGPWPPLEISAEFDALFDSELGSSVRTGHAAWLQADLEAVRGVHLLAAAEDLDARQHGLWAGASWFVIAHLDVRADFGRRFGAGAAASNTFLIQLNGSL